MMKPIYVYFVGLGDGGQLGWKIISWFSRSPIVHVGIMLEEPQGRVCYETSEKYFEMRTWESRKDGTEIVDVYKLDVPDATWAQVRATAQSFVGTPYDYKGIIFLGMFLLLERAASLAARAIAWAGKRFGVTVDTDVRFSLKSPLGLGKDSALYCSEATGQLLHAAGAEHLFPPDYATPESLYRWAYTMLVWVDKEAL